MLFNQSMNQSIDESINQCTSSMRVWWRFDICYSHASFRKRRQIIEFSNQIVYLLPNVVHWLHGSRYLMTQMIFNSSGIIFWVGFISLQVKIQSLCLEITKLALWSMDKSYIWVINEWIFWYVQCFIF